MELEQSPAQAPAKTDSTSHGQCPTGGKDKVASTPAQSSCQAQATGQTQATTNANHTASENQNRRRTIVINKPVQSRIILHMAWPPAVCLGLTAVVLGIFCAQLSQEAIAADVELPSILPVFITVICFLLVATGFLLFNALRFSHRIAGPMYRFQKTLESVQSGDLHARANLRKYDFLGEVADSINEFLDWLEEHPPQGIPQPDRQDKSQGQNQSQGQNKGHNQSKTQGHNQTQSQSQGQCQSESQGQNQGQMKSQGQSKEHCKTQGKGQDNGTEKQNVPSYQATSGESGPCCG